MNCWLISTTSSMLPTETTLSGSCFLLTTQLLLWFHKVWTSPVGNVWNRLNYKSNLPTNLACTLTLVSLPALSTNSMKIKIKSPTLRLSTTVLNKLFAVLLILSAILTSSLKLSNTLSFPISMKNVVTPSTFLLPTIALLLLPGLLLSLLSLVFYLLVLSPTSSSKEESLVN